MFICVPFIHNLQLPAEEEAEVVNFWKLLIDKVNSKNIILKGRIYSFFNCSS